MCLLLFLLSGCNAVGYVAAAAQGEDMVEASYKGLAGQKCGVMVWADDGVLDDRQAIQLDTAKGIQLKLQEAAKVNVSEVANITWTSPEQILQYQQNHPETAGEAAEEIAPRLGITRLIYIEVEEFATHPNDSPDLWRGQMTATLKVVEITGTKAKVAYAERGVNAVAPRNCPPEGLPNLDEDAVYKGTVDAFTSEIGKRFVPHEADVDAWPPPDADQN
jgi:hypothetical protein